MTKAHQEQLRPDLVFRHALPFCITEETFFGFHDQSDRVLAALIAGHTLALTHLDYHLDGSPPDPLATATARQMDPATAVAYTVRMIYAAGKIADGIHGRVALFREVFDPISGFVVLRMHKDWSERYLYASLRHAQEALQDYLTSPTSRLLGSGYWEVMVRGSFASHAKSTPVDLINVVQELRRLRQVVDEIADFDEDLSAGLATAPLLFALASSRLSDRISSSVRELWRSSESSGEVLDTQLVEDIRQLVHDARGFERASSYADSVWRKGVALCNRTLRHQAEGFVTLFDLKRAKLAEISDADWRNARTDSFLV
jgi:hypothetical protein